MKRLLLLGDSLIAWGRWERLLPGMTVQNRGIPGEWLAELSLRLGGELTASPGCDAVVLQSGTNDLLGGDAGFPAIYADMLPRLRLLAEERTVIVLCSLAPMSIIPPPRIQAINRQLQALAAEVEHCLFLDLAAPFSMPGPPVFLNDQIHFSIRGYQLWADALRRLLHEALPAADSD